MKVLRSSVIAAVAIVAAACGDKVTVTAPQTVTTTTTTTTTTTPVGKVNSVSVAPATATLTIGQTISMTAAVNADAGIATTVTWSTSDATKATVSAVGLVAAVAATPGVAICATSTVNTGVKGCGSVVVTAASATVPATASISGVFAGNLTLPVDPTNVVGRINVQVNMSPGTEVISKVYLLLGTTVVDSQNFTAAQSAALRYAADNAGAANDVAQPTVVLTANTAAFNATTGAVTYPNATGLKLSVQLFVVGNTAVRSTATYSNTLTLNNPDAIFGSYTLPSTKVTATDAAGYQWTSFGGGNATLNVVPVLYSGKVVASATVKYPNMSAVLTYCNIAGADNTGCTILPSTADTLTTKTVAATGAFAVSVGLTDREYTGVLPSPVTPTISLVYSDGSSTADGAFAATSLPGLALRIDNKGPAAPAITAPAFNGSTSSLRPVVSFAVRSPITAVSTVADSGKLINSVPADAGVSAGATLTALNGLTFKAFQNSGGTGTATTDSIPTYGATAIASNLVGYSEAGAFCFRLKAFDALGNASPNYREAQVKSGAITTRSCAATASAANGQISAKVDGTAPVTAFAGVANGDFSAADTGTAAAFGAGILNYYYTLTEANAGTDSISVCYYKNVSNTMTPTEYIGGGATTACAARAKSTGSGTNKAFQTATAQLNQLTSAIIAASGEIVITSQHYDAAGNIGNKITRVMTFDATVPSVSLASVGGITQGSAAAISAFLNDDMDVAQYALETAQNTAATATASVLTGTAASIGLQATAGAVAGYAVLRGGYTTTEAANVVPYTKFLNVAVSTTSDAATYIMPFTTTAAGTVADQLEIFKASQAAYRMFAIDQTGNPALGGVVNAATVADAWTVGTLAGTASSPIAGATNAMTAVALDGSFVYNTDYAASSSALSGPRVLSSQVRVKTTRFAKMDQTAAFWNNGVNASTTGLVYCTGRTTATGGSPIMNGVSAVSESRIPASTSAPVVSLYLPIRSAGASQASFQFYATASLLNTATVPGAASNNCGDIVTETWAVTVTPGLQAFPAQAWTGGSALWVARSPRGIASVLPMGIAYNR